VSVAEFGELTPHELMLVLDAHNERLQHQREDMLTQAWLTASWQRARRMPALRQVLEQSRPRHTKPQTPEQILTVVKHLQAKYEMEEG